VCHCWSPKSLLCMRDCMRDCMLTVIGSAPALQQLRSYPSNFLTMYLRSQWYQEIDCLPAALPSSKHRHYKEPWAALLGSSTVCSRKQMHDFQQLLGGHQVGEPSQGIRQRTASAQAHS
jgi:hypothetical protein